MGASLAATVLLSRRCSRDEINERADNDPMMMAVLEDQGVVRMVVEQTQVGSAPW
jgi:hypothetical protein